MKPPRPRSPRQTLRALERAIFANFTRFAQRSRGDVARELGISKGTVCTLEKRAAHKLACALVLLG